MERFTPYLGIAAALVVGGFAAIFIGGPSVFQAPASNGHITSTTLPGLNIVHEKTPAPQYSTTQRQNTENATSSGEIAPKTETAKSAASSAPVADQKKTNPTSATSPASPMTISTPTSPVPSSTPAQATVLSESADAQLNASAALLRGALVNILCYVPANSGLHSISGSGVIIDPKGIILTNAHIAQYFLLVDKNVSCSIRTGSPAVDSYSAALIYIPTIWLQTNKSVLTQANPSGTGQYDFALLAITKSETTHPLPASFPSIALAESPPAANTPVVIASYGAQFLDTSQIQSDLFPTIVFGSIKQVLTFAVRSVDVLALGGSAAAQEGSSGGGVSDASGELVGTITTSTVQGATDSRSLNAISASYVRAEYASETGQPIDQLISEPTATALSNFAAQLPSLEAVIAAQLPQ
ncbi:MAG: trypsin-like peptidase domain-containing protein [Minisyncoccia bacterium]